VASMGNYSSVRVLYIDDNASLCGIFRASVEAQGYVVDTALSGEDGIAKFAANPYDVVALEYCLPDQTGIDVARHFLATFPNLPILIVTGEGDERVAVETMMLGNSNYIVKGDVTVYLELIPGSISQLIERAAQHRKQIETEQALRGSNDRLRDFAKASSDWFWELGPDLKFTYISDRVEELCGVSAKSHIGKTRQEFAAEDVGLSNWDKYTEALRLREPFRGFEYIRRREDGSLSTLSVSGTPIFSKDGDFCGYRGTGTDVTEKAAIDSLVRKNAEGTLRQWSKLTTALDTIDESVVIYDNQDRLVFANQQQKEFYPDIAKFYDCPGTPMETIVRHHGETIKKDNPSLNLDDYVNERIPGIPQENTEYQLNNGRWVSKTLRRTADGGTINVRADITDKRTAERDIIEKDHLLTAAIESVDGGIAIYDCDDRLVLHNTKYKKYLCDVASQIKPGAQFKDLATGLAKSGFHGHLPDGIDGWVSSRMKMFDEGGKAVPHKDKYGNWRQSNFFKLEGGGTFLLTLNVTDMMEAVLAKEESEQRFKDFTASSADWTWEMDADLCFSYVSPNIERIIGVKPEWHYGKTRTNLLGNDYDPELWEPHVQAMKNRQPFRDFVYYRAVDDHEPKWLRTSGIPIFNSNHDFVGYRGTGSDITAQVITDQALRESETHLRAIIDNAPMAVYLKKLGGEYVLVNKVHEQWFGFSLKDIHGKTAEQFLTPKLAKLVLKQDNQVLESGKATSIELDVVSPDGTTRQTVLTKFPVRDDEGNIIAIGGINIDMTERKNLEAQLSQSQKMEAVGQLTGGIAHDFNNMLAVMTGNLEQALDVVELNEKAYHNIEVALDAVDKGAALTQHLLSFSRQQTLSPSIADTNELIMDILRLLKRTLGENIEISTNFTDKRLPINIDGAILSNALVNLAINARDAMPDGGTLTISTSIGDFKDIQLGPNEKPADGKYALIAVSDTGTGINTNDVDHVFEPFFTTKDVGRGSGLGLSMVYGFVQQSNGHIGINSKKGKGTAISIYLPIAVVEEERQIDARPQQSFALSRRCILLVEDDPIVRETTASILLNYGYQVFEAEDGPSALDVLEEKFDDIDLVITDIVMPNNLNGIKLAEQITEKYKNIKVLLTSGYPDRIADMKTMGIELLAKPYRRAQLAAAIERTMSRQSIH
jgi:PAS domain S-box-containing protein